MSDGPKKDPEIESAKKAIAEDASDRASSSEEEPTVEEQGTMTPGQGSVQQANASGVNPDK